MALHMFVFRKLIRRLVRRPSAQGKHSATSAEIDIYYAATSRAFPIIVDFLPDALKRNRIGAVFLLDSVDMDNAVPALSAASTARDR